jgi:hypothetical protein
MQHTFHKPMVLSPLPSKSKLLIFNLYSRHTTLAPLSEAMLVRSHHDPLGLLNPAFHLNRDGRLGDVWCVDLECNVALVKKELFE